MEEFVGALMRTSSLTQKKSSIRWVRPVTHQDVLGRYFQASQQSSSIQMLFSGRFWKQTIFSLYYFVILHLHCPAGFVINVLT